MKTKTCFTVKGCGAISFTSEIYFTTTSFVASQQKKTNVEATFESWIEKERKKIILHDKS